MDPALHAIPVLYLLHFEQIRRRCALQQRIRRRRPPIFRPVPHLATVEDIDIIRKFRLDRLTLQELCAHLEPHLKLKRTHPAALSATVKVMAALHFFATGSSQYTVSSAGGMSQPMFSMVLRDVLSALMLYKDSYVHFPRRDELTAVMGDFFDLGGIPNVVGAIDGTHIGLVPPQAREHIYLNRKKLHSINVQVVCQADQLISHVCAKFPGSVHDSYILRNSSIPRLMANLHPAQAWLVGDSGYPNLPWLMTPLRNPTTPGEVLYNDAHGRTRCVVERTFGLLKSRFRCLDKSGGALLYSPQKVCQIIVACCMLHNLALRKKIPLILDDDEQQQPPAPNPHMPSDDDSGEEEGLDVRQHLITNNFL